MYGLSQNYSNSWIDYSQKYYRIPITNEGIYKVTYADLVSYGISIGDFDPRNLQIIHNGKTLPLYVSGESDFVFNNTDYFEFYAPGKNTGWLDTAIYINYKPLNPEYSIYNDTASYFLTFANTLESPRYDTARNVNYGSYSPLNYCYKKVRQDFYSIYNDYEKSPYFNDGEGWTDNNFNMGTYTEKTLSTPYYINVGKPYTLKFGLSGYSDTRHDIFVDMATGSNPYSPIFDTIYSSFGAIHRTYNYTGTLGNPTNIKFSSISGYGKLEDKNCVAYVEINYPHTYNFEGSNFFTFTLPKVTSGSFILLNIINFDGDNAPVLYCPGIEKRLVAHKNGTTYQVLIPNYNKEVECVFASTSSFLTVPKILNVKSKNTASGNPSEFYDLTSAANEGNYIIITNSSLWTYANAYKTYRTSTGYNVTLIDINEIYNQFGYGIQKHPIAIHNFIEYATKEWGVKPEYIFLIGKGYHLTDFRNNPTTYANTFIPPMGYLASDQLFTTDLHGNSIIPNIAIGRLAARTNTDIDYYRKKVIEHEKQIPDEWMKTVLHFGGGNTAREKNLLKGYLAAYEDTLEREYFGANVYTFLKESSDVFEKTEPEAIREHINDGTSILNFFAHAAGTGFDQNIDHPSLFNNQGKYPLIIANSCLSGDVFTPISGFNETWTFIPNKGCIGFIASVGLGTPTYLNEYTSRLINNIAKDNYGNSIGSSIQLTMKSLDARAKYDMVLKSAALNIVLHGDPAVKVHSFINPDLELNASSIFFNPSIVTTDLETFTMNVVVSNKAKTTKDTCNLHIVFTAGSGKIYTIDSLISGFFLRDTFALTFPVDKFESGNYKVSVYIDSYDSIPELDETNNEVTIDFFISSRDVLPVYPLKYAIIPTDTVQLTVSAVDPFKPPYEIVIELDTSATFTSTQKISKTIQTNGNAIISWDPDITLIENRVYFWRVTNTDSIKWNESSFVYENDKNGWAQKHPHQFIENKLSYLNFTESTNSYDYFSIFREIYCVNAGSTAFNTLPTSYSIDGTQYGSSGSTLYDEMHIVVMDSISLIPWYKNRDNYGHWNYSQGGGDRYFIFPTSDPNYRLAMETFIKDSIPNGNYILAFSYKSTNFVNWEESLLQVFDDLGATLPRVSPSNYAYILFAKKGDKSITKESLGTAANTGLTQTTNVTSNYYQGNIESTIIGPTKHFQELVWENNKTGNEASEISINSTATQNQNVVLENGILGNYDRLDTLIRADLYPYIQLNNFNQDILTRTPPHLKYWKVYYDPVGELAVNPKYNFSIVKDTVQQGESVIVNVSAQNVSFANMDSVLIMYEIRDSENKLVALEYQRVGAVEAQAWVNDVLEYNTKNLSGLNTIKIEFNPINPETGEYDQPETYRINNTIVASFFVVTDNTKPVLDVVVDGRHVMNNEYISAKPYITITLFDENKFLPLQDTSLFEISITNLQTGITTPYYFSQGQLQFIPAKDSAGKCYVIFTPEFLENGQYTLTVQAHDASKNDSGLQEYSITFSIELEQKISVLYNYPNPCKNYTTFRFILTGSEVPKNMNISIYAADGKLVQNIPINKLTNVHIGTNSIDAYWNGTDEAGNILADGIYTYTLTFTDSSQFGHLQTDHDQYMNVKYGRLIIQK